jgi:ABC-type multidrug transport system fused ATPase/permease subunit
MGGRLFPITVLVLVSVVAGLAEAGVLVLVANVAAAMVLHTHYVASGFGLLNSHLTIGTALLLALGLALVRLALQVVVAWLPARISADVQARLRTDLFEAYTGASWTVQAEDADGYLQELMTDQVNQATSAVVVFANLLSSAAMFLALLISAVALNALVALVVLACSVLLFALLRPIDRLGREAASDQSQANLDHAGGVSETVRLAEEMQVFGSASAHRRRVGLLIQSAREATFRTTLTNRLVNNVYQSLVILLIVGGLAGLYLVRAGHLADLGAVVLMLVRASAYGQQFQSANHTVVQTMPYIDRLDNAEARYRASAQVDQGQTLANIRELVFDHVDFAYTKDRMVLHDVSFEVEAGEAVGIIGPTGAGKSTLSQLLLRLREPTLGVYLVNGETANTFSRSDWQRRVAYVAQEPRVLHGTVADNIRFFRDIDQASIEDAARRSHIHDEIVAMPAGYDTMIGQRSDAVSGGQRQRICLARALAGRPDMLLLDEPTSALDLASEAAVKASLADLRGHVTLFIVAHRLPLIDICDRILVLERGRLKAFASAAELHDQNAFYRRIVALAGRPSRTTEPNVQSEDPDTPKESRRRPKTA